MPTRAPSPPIRTVEASAPTQRGWPGDPSHAVRWRCDERGAGSVVVLTLAAALGLATLVALSLAGAVAARHRAMTAADLGALAGAGAAVRGADPCTESARVAAANGARLRRCSARRAVVTVAVDLPWRPGWGVPLPSMDARAVSRAGPVQPVPGPEVRRPPAVETQEPGR